MNFNAERSTHNAQHRIQIVQRLGVEALVPSAYLHLTRAFGTNASTLVELRA
jgi:hypothetical protein